MHGTKSMILGAGLALAAATAPLSAAPPEGAAATAQSKPEAAQSAQANEPKQGLQSGAANAQTEDLTALLMDLEQLERRLAEIQQAAIVQNPELREQAQSLQQLMVDRMEAEGYSPEERLQRIQEIRTELGQPTLTEADRQRLISEAQQEQQQLAEAEAAAMEYAEVQQAARDFEEQLLAAMKAQDPETERLIEQYESRNQQLQAMLEQAPAGAAPQE